MLNWSDGIQKHPECVVHDSEGETVVVLPTSGKFVVLNATGARILELADGGRSLADVAVAISEDFQAPLDVVRQDVMTFAEQLLQRGVLLCVETN